MMVEVSVPVVPIPVVAPILVAADPTQAVAAVPIQAVVAVPTQAVVAVPIPIVAVVLHLMKYHNLGKTWFPG